MTDENRWYEPLADWRLWVPPTIASCLLIIVVQYSPLGFHTFVELFAIVISFVMFSLAWSTRKFSTNNFLLFLACGYFWIGSLDLMHTLVYKGMNVFVEGSGNLAVQFWIGARYFEALVLLVAPFAMSRKQNGQALFAVFGIIAAGLTVSVLSGHFPTGFVEGKGLTDFKIYSEYLINLILLLALILLYRYGTTIPKLEKTLISVSIVMTMGAELAFTFYVDVFGLSNIAGHFLKLFSFWFIFQAIIVSNLKNPYQIVRLNEARFREYAESAADAFWETDADHRFTFLSTPILETPDQDMVGAIVGKRREDITVIRYSDAGLRELNTYIDDHKPFQDVQVSMIRSVDELEYLVEISGKPVFDEKGTFKGYRGSTQDITEKKHLEEQLRRSQKMDAIGQLTGGIAHDFNNMLGVVMGNLEILQPEVEGNDEALRRINIALTSVGHGADLTRKLLNYSRLEPQSTKLTSVNDFVRNMEELIVKTLTVAINVELHLAEGPWLVEVDPGDLQDALLNLALNARDAMSGGGSLVIETVNKTLDEDYARRNLQGEAGEFVMLSISDTGSGMSPEIRERVFEPFFSTKEKGRGTGLGLSMVYGFVQRSGGHLKIYSEPGKGTTIRIYLPRAKPSAEMGIAEPEKAPLPGGGETILVVDDEDTMRDVAVAHLERLGYKTIVASSGKEGLRRLMEDQEIDLLFTDVVMPGSMDGYELARQARGNRPALKILLTSGFTKKREEAGNEDPFDLEDLQSGMLSKPYSRIELALAVRRNLDAAN
jgi:signal transduction histidine kinase/CheY-like chemotaxis protein